MGSNEGGDHGGVTGTFLNLIDEVQASGPRTTIFIAGIAFFIAAIVLPGNQTMLVWAGIITLLVLVIDIVRGGTISD